MPLNPGNTPLTFSPPARFEQDKYHTVGAGTGDPFTQAGCMIQPLSVRDKVTNTAYAEATDKVFTPFNSSVGGVSAEWYVSDSVGDSYRVLGVESVSDQFGRTPVGVFVVKAESG